VLHCSLSLILAQLHLKGNKAFKAGDYPAAIDHYTTAILTDRKDAIYPLNRAAAYLKLGKYVRGTTFAYATFLSQSIRVEMKMQNETALLFCQ
jgi:tetratricopeptide (TPR) repeat protein